MLFSIVVALAATPQDVSPQIPTPEPTNGWIAMNVNWSPDGKQLAYSGGHFDDPKKFDPKAIAVTLIDADGKNKTRIPTVAFGGSFSRDGKSLILNTQDGPRRFLSRYDIQSKTITEIAPGAIKDTAAACSPTADTLLFNTDRGDDLQSWIMNLDGSGAKALTHGPGKAYNPEWSPDGKKIVYYRELGDQHDQIYVMNSDGSGEVRVSNPDEHNYYPTFLANGDLCFINSKGPGTTRAVITDLSGKIKRVWPYQAFTVKWSPDGKKAAFVYGKMGASAVYVADADGSHVVKLSD